MTISVPAASRGPRPAARPPASRRAWGGPPAGLLALGAALHLWLVWMQSTEYMLRVDDSYYYFQIARNAAAGHGFTFDGIHATNGF